MKLMACAALAATALGCSVVSPPPMMARHDTLRLGPVGHTDLTLSGGVGGGVFVADGAGGDLRLGWQATPELALGANLGGGAAIAPDDENGAPTAMLAGRVTARYQPGPRWLALGFGLGGGGTDAGELYATVDAGLNAAAHFGEVFTLYGGPLLALSVPVRRGDAFGSTAEDCDCHHPPTTTWYAGTSIGLGFQLGDDWSATTELTTLGGESAQDGVVVMSVTGGLTRRF